MRDYFEARRPHQGMSFAQYLARFEEEEARLHAPDWHPADDTALARAQHMALNLQRTRRIGRSYAPGEAIREALARLVLPQLWLVLTEPWCGDSAQLLPCIAKLAALNPLIDLRLLRRDENPDIMDQHLTGGKRSIPKLIAFDPRGNELFEWGPRPGAASELFATERARGLPKDEILRRLHQWYGADRGRSLEAELLARLIARDTR
jgi:hypothetical protein